MKKHDDGQISISREELYALVWETPMLRLAGRFHLSNVGLAKVCKKHSIPRPPPGHWAKLANGKAVRKTELPATCDSSAALIQFTAPHAKKYGTAAKASKAKLSVPVAKSLGRPHVIVAELQAAFRGKKPDEQGLLWPRPGSDMDIYVSAASVNRALLIFQAVLRALEANGDEVSTQKDYSGWHMVAVLGGDPIGFSLRELVNRKEVIRTEAELAKKPWLRSSKDYTNHPTGKLVLQIRSSPREGTRCRWADGKVQRLENLLPDFVPALYVAAKALGDREREWAEHRKLEAVKERKRKEERRLQEIEEAHFRNLIGDVDAWHQSNRIRAYVTEVLGLAVKAQGQLTDGNYHKKWAAWALAHADRVDPLVSS